MDSIYQKLSEQLKSMTPEQEKAEWEELKEYNFGPTMEEYEMLVMQCQIASSQYSFTESNNSPLRDLNNSEDNYFLAA